MSVQFDENKKIFKLDTDRTTYMIGLTAEGYLGHIYYGPKVKVPCGQQLLRTVEYPFSPSVMPAEKAAFLDTLPMEYPTGGAGGYRETALELDNEIGQWKDCRNEKLKTDPITQYSFVSYNGAGLKPGSCHFRAGG